MSQPRGARGTRGIVEKRHCEGEFTPTLPFNSSPCPPRPPWLILLFTRQSRLRAQQAAERDLFYFICDFLASQSAVRPVPSRKPEQHPEQAEGRHCGVDVFQFAFVFQLPQRV